MPLGPNNMQTTQLDNALVILFALANFLLEEFGFLFFGHVVNIFLNSFLFVGPFVRALLWHLANVVYSLSMFAQDSIKVTSRIAPQQNVGTSTSHVGSNSHCPTATCLGHDLCLTLVMFCVEHVV